MKICVAQTRPFKGDVRSNIEGHLSLIGLTAEWAVDAIFFPELSITGYEPGLARQLAMTADDGRLAEFQKLSDGMGMIIGIGAPLKVDRDGAGALTGAQGVMIGMVIFRPGAPRMAYCKQHLHKDELPFFVPGKGQAYLDVGDVKIGLSICYELSVPEHTEQLSRDGSDIYLSSVAKTAAGVEKAGETLAATSARYGMAVLMSNCIGHCDDFDCGGGSAVWNRQGRLLGQLDRLHEGILIFNTQTEEVIEKLL
jgi:predicted amidohydrolase